MFKLIKVLIVLAVLAGLAYFVFFVPLGKMTMYQHLLGISKTEEAQNLGSEIEAKATDLKSEVGRRLPIEGEAQKKDAPPKENTPTPGSQAAKEKKTDPAAADPLSNLSDDDRAALMELLKKKSSN